VLSTLSQRLVRSVAQLSDGDNFLGQPELVERAAAESARLFQSTAKALPSEHDARAASLALLQQKSLTDRQIDMVAGVLCDPVAEYNEALPVGQEPFKGLLQSYRALARAGDLPRLTWYALLSSYFKFNPNGAKQTEVTGWEGLRSFLQETWPLIDRQSQQAVVPEWMVVLRSDPELIGERAAQRYAADCLRGNEEATHKLATDLAIPQSSWFWHLLVLAAVEQAIRTSDEQFKRLIPRLISLIQGRPVYRDEALISMLTRYHSCREKPAHQDLRDYVVRKDVWRNPKLKAAGMATTWNRVSDDVWRMVLSWINEINLREFFEILASRHHADEGRLEFWTKYLNQISWTRLIFGSETMSLARRNRHVSELIAREEGSYAQLTAGSRDSDAFIMQIGEYVIVEFSVTGNAAYVYSSDTLKFNRNAKTYEGNTNDLKYGFNGGAMARIVHKAPWEQEAASTLRHLGIYPDSANQAPRGPSAPFVARPTTQSTARANPEPPTGTRSQESQAPAQSSNSSSSGGKTYLAEPPPGASFKMAVLAEMIKRVDGAFIDDKRKADGTGGRLWVENPKQNFQLERMLKLWGFVWAASRGAYYFPERR
jgi:hypothetical protein